MNNSNEICLWPNVSNLTNYSVILLDLWGVVHDGVKPFKNVIDTMIKLKYNSVKIILLSNSPRRNLYLKKQLEKIGVPEEAYDNLLSSGELSYQYLKKKSKKNNKNLFYRICPVGGDFISEDLGDQQVDNIEVANYILLIGPENDEVDTVEKYKSILHKAREKSIPIICANPDLSVMRGDKLVLCAGSIAKEYENIGGKVIYFGKPYPATYEACFKMYPKIDKHKFIAVGDGHLTDILGAGIQKIDSVFVVSGLSKDKLIFNNEVNFNAVSKLFLESGVMLPKALITRFSW